MIRKASILDYDEIAKIYTASYSQKFYGQLEFSPDSLHDSMLTSLSYPHETLLFQTDEGKTAGFLKASECFRYLDKLYILPSYQNLGIGEKLVREYLNLATAALEPGEMLWLEVNETNLEAIALYQRLGYRRTKLQQISKIENSLTFILERLR